MLIPDLRLHRLSRISGLIAWSLAVLCCSASAFADTKTEIEDLGDGEKRVTLTQTVEPSFHIEPIVHRFSARRGAVIPFKFEIRSTGKAMDVTVEPVKLRQEPSGIILHDDLGEPPTEIVFSSPSEFKLSAGQTAYVEGEVTVPLAKSNYLSFGVLVRDRGQTSADAGTLDGQTISAGVRFVTQYVLRIDIETGVKDLTEMNRLAFEAGQIRSESGMPIAEAILANPTDFAFECNVRGTVTAINSSRPRPFRLATPSRSSLVDDEKYLVRVMPQSQVRVFAPVEEMLFPGRQSLVLEVTNGRRALVEQAFDFSVGSGDFAALEVKQAFLDHELSVGPAQIEIGNQDNVKRSCNLRFNNNSDKTKRVIANMVDLNGDSIEEIRMSSSKFDVRPGRTKTIRLSVPSRIAGDQTQFGRIDLNVADDGNPDGSSSSVPLALIAGTRPTEQVDIGELESLVKAGQTSFRLRVTNKGSGYVPVHGELQIADGSGTAQLTADGYGKWLMPGESRELAFVPPRNLKAGQYQLSIHVETTPTAKPYDRTLIVELGADATYSK